MKNNARQFWLKVWSQGSIAAGGTGSQDWYRFFNG
jgi:hypothetical protein